MNGLRMRELVPDPPSFSTRSRMEANGGDSGKAERETSSELEELKRQLQDKSLELNKEIALRKLLNSEKDEQAKRLRAAEQRLEQLSASSATSSSTIPCSSAAAVTAEAGTTSGGEPLVGLLRETEERNEELSTRLHESEVEVQRLRLAQLRLETTNSARVAAQSAELMKRLSSMQREREKVLTTQLRVALKERQEALERAGELVHGKDVTKLAENTELREIFQGMRATQDPHELKHHGAILVAKVKALKEERDGKIREKLRSLQSEKAAVEKRARELVFDVARLQRRLEMMETEYKLVDKTRIKALQAQLEATLQERDQWQERSSKLEDMIETLKIVNSLQKSLKKEEEVTRSYELEVQRYKVELEAAHSTIEEIVVERNMAIVERNQVVKERNELAVKVQQEFDRAEQLKRIVNVLRKKTRHSSASSDSSVRI